MTNPATSETLSTPARAGAGAMAFHLAILAICSLAIVLTYSFDSVPPPLVRGMPPETFPRLVAGLTAALTLVSLLKEIRQGTGKASDLPAPFWPSLAAIAAFPLVAIQLDLLLAMSLFIALIMPVWGSRRPLLIASLALAAPLILFFVFGEMLDIRFPRGVIVNLIYG